MFGVIPTKINTLWKVYLWFKKFLLSPHPSKFRLSGTYTRQLAISVIFIPHCSWILVNINLVWHKFKTIINILGNISPSNCMVLKPVCSVWTLDTHCLCNSFLRGGCYLYFFSLHIVLIIFIQRPTLAYFPFDNRKLSQDI